MAQVLDATPDTAVRLRAFMVLSGFGYRDAAAAFRDLFRSAPGAWFADLADREPGERLIAVLTTQKLIGAPPADDIEKAALRDLIAKYEAVLQARLDEIAEEECRQGWEYTEDQLPYRLDRKPPSRKLNLWPVVE